MNKERPASAEEAASALSRALLSVGQATSPAVAKPVPAEGEEAKQAGEYEDGLESDSLDEEDEESDDQEEDDA
eukprot:COSAG02_NODE_122_length_35306_cov_98.280967_34_plen_73_part_00